MPRILVVQHEEGAPAAHLGRWLAEAGLELDVRHPYRGDELPTDLREHAALLVLGGSMGANDGADFAWLVRAQELVRDAASNEVPVLGVCLGHQLVATALGGEVELHPDGQTVGVKPMGWTDAAESDALFGALVGVADRALHWNSDVVTVVPDAAEVLARTEDGMAQVVRYAPTVWGIQAHPEVDAEVIRPWAENDRAGLEAQGRTVEGELASMREVEADLLAAWPALAQRLSALATDGH